MSLPQGGLVPVKPGSARTQHQQHAHSNNNAGLVGTNSNNNNSNYGMIGGPTSNSMNASMNTANMMNASQNHHHGQQQQQPSPRAQQHSSRGARPSGDATNNNNGGGTHFPQPGGGVAHGGGGGGRGGGIPDERVLTVYEREELRSFDHGIYYCGESCAAKIQAPTTGPNYGFDDERGDYILVTGDHVRFRYEIKNILGRGSFGQVACCIDHKTGQQIALKIIRNKKRFHQQAQVEIRVLAHLRDRDPDGKYGIVRFLDSFVFRSHVCITYELLSMNLFEYIKLSKFRPQPLNLVKKIGASVLISLAFMSRENIVHCDLKPENILLRQPNRTGVKVIDLGSACFENERLYTYIQSRFYRAPEVILGIPYTRKIDLWSFACVLCELAVGYPIFPGESEVDQLACMMEFLGVPPKHLLDEAPRRSVFFDVVDGQYSPKLVPNSRKKIRHPNTKFLHKFLGLEEDHLFVHFVSMFFRWDPAERPHAEPAMRHPWICDAYVGVTPKMPNVPGLPPPAGWMNQKSSGGGGGGNGASSQNQNQPSSRSNQQQQQSSSQNQPTSSARMGDTTARTVQPQTAHHPHNSTTASNQQQQQDGTMFPSITTPRQGGGAGAGGVVGAGAAGQIG